MRHSIKPPGVRRVTLIAIGLLLGGCAGGPGAKNRLPDEGPTTLQVYEQHLAGDVAGEATPTGPAPTPPPFRGAPIAPQAATASRITHQALTDLQQDFQRVPNPEILGFVYPHLAGDLPVPGYYTAFPLYEGLHYAEPGEGQYLSAEALAP